VSKRERKEGAETEKAAQMLVLYNQKIHLILYIIILLVDVCEIVMLTTIEPEFHAVI
jgi:hypothetical protein